MSGRPLILLDRDGVINEESEAYVKAPSEFLPIPGSLDAIARLSAAGHPIAVVTNQSAVGRGLISPATLESIHAGLREAVGLRGGSIDRIEVCPHRPDAGCDCRKPATGLLRSAARHLERDAATSVLIGDRASDLQAARSFGCEALLVRTGHGRATEKTVGGEAALGVFDDLARATDWILAERLGSAARAPSGPSA